MARSRGRHAAQKSRGAATVVAALVGVGAVAGGVGLAVTQPWKSDTGEAAAAQASSPGSAAASASTGAPASGGSDCSSDISVWAGAAGSVDLSNVDPGVCTTAASSAQNADLTLAPGDPGSKGTVVATSPVVLAVPEDAAEAFGTLDQANLQKWILGEKTWANSGKKELGDFKIVSDDPKNSSVAALGYGALLRSAVGEIPTKAPDYANPSRGDLVMIKTEHRFNVTDTSAEQALGAGSLSDLARNGAVVLTTAQAVTAHNAADPKVRFKALPLLGGAVATPVMANVSADSTSADAVLKALSGTAGTAALRKAGYAESNAASLAAVTPTMLATVRQVWAAAHTRNSTLAVVDLSGSMNGHFEGTDGSKLQALRALVTLSYTVASPKAGSTVWFFNTVDGKPNIQDDLPLQLNDATSGGTTHSQKVVAATGRAKAQGGTPLFLSVRQAYEHAQKNYLPGMRNSVLVLSDGANEDSGSDYTLKQLTDYLKRAYDPKKPININSVLLTTRDRPEMTQISQITKGTVIKVANAGDVGKVMRSAIFN
ncbi:hypothetical protein ACMYYO_01515 [Dermacoccaceae bacterium W4C1]